MKRTMLAFMPIACLLAACTSGASDSVPGDSEDTRPYAGIEASETVKLIGNEPFWGGSVTGTELTYSTPDDIDGTTISVERFAGRGGVSFSGTLDGADLRMAVTPGACSDTMSDRTYPFVVTLDIGGELREGCGWTERQPFDGLESP